MNKSRRNPVIFDHAANLVKSTRRSRPGGCEGHGLVERLVMDARSSKPGGYGSIPHAKNLLIAVSGQARWRMHVIAISESAWNADRPISVYDLRYNDFGFLHDLISPLSPPSIYPPMHIPCSPLHTISIPEILRHHWSMWALTRQATLLEMESPEHLRKRIDRFEIFRCDPSLPSPTRSPPVFETR